MFVYELSGCEFESHCSHLIFKLYTDDNKSLYSSNFKGIRKCTRKIYEKLYTKQTSNAATTEFLSKIPNIKKIFKVI